MQIVEIEYGSETLHVTLPVSCDVKEMGVASVLTDPAGEILRSYNQPIGSPPLTGIAREKCKGKHNPGVTIVVSDNTRPVPYRGRNGILQPLLHTLINTGYPENRITILIGNGSHRPMTDVEIEKMLGIREAGFNVPVMQHDYEDEGSLVYVGKTDRGSPVHINRHYAMADLKIITGLVESHFMAGVSGGRKAICPGIASKETLHIFHGPWILESPESADLVLEGNPCNEEAAQAAGLAGCDFAVNVTLDADKNITGIFSGDIVASHQAAVDRIRDYVVVRLGKRYDLVLIPAGFVGVNHYQAAKAAIEASRAVKPGGSIIITARHSDPDPVGSANYKKILALLKKTGPKKFLQTIKSPDWVFTHDQWEVQMWSKVLEVTGEEENLVYCNCEIPEKEYSILPGIPGHSLLHREELEMLKSPGEKMQRIIEKSAAWTVRRFRETNGRNPDVLFLKDGPYGIPEVFH